MSLAFLLFILLGISKISWSVTGVTNMEVVVAAVETVVLLLRLKLLLEMSFSEPGRCEQSLQHNIYFLPRRIVNKRSMDLDAPLDDSSRYDTDI